MKACKFLSLLFALCALFTLSCQDPAADPDDPNKGGNNDDQRIDVINGTQIEDGMTAVGLVYDAASGQGIPDVPVTDGYSYVTTDANGVYQMAANRYTRRIYLSLPAEYKVPLDPATNLPLIYSDKAFNKSVVNRNDFKLEKQAVEDNFTLIMIGDPQCQNTSQINRYKTETIPSMLSTLNQGIAEGRYPNPYGMTLGDITFDSNELWGGMKESMSNLKLNNGSYFPIFQCIGNHDHDSLQQNSDYDATGKFVEYFGPTDYSFNRGQAHIIVMDDIQCTKVSSNSSPNRYTWGYTGGFTNLQYNWLKDDISHVRDKNKKIAVLCMHIPMRAGAASGGASFNTGAFYKEVLTLLRGFKEAHIMIGHTHYAQNYIHGSYICAGGQPIYEHVHGAACGGWWSCDSNVTGAPNGYSIYEVEGNTMKNWVLKGTKTNFDYQIRVYDGNQVYTGDRSYTYSWSNTANKGGSSNITAVGNTNLKNAFVAEVFNDDDKFWTLEMWQNGSKMGDFKRLSNGSCCNVCLASYFFNQLGKNTDTWTNKTASHYWYFVPASKTPAAEKGWEVRATQVIPTSNVVNNYSCTHLTTDYSEF